MPRIYSEGIQAQKTEGFYYVLLEMYSLSHYLCLYLWKSLELIDAVQFSSVSQSCPTLCNPINRSTPGLPVHHQLPEFTQIHIHWVNDAIQPSHPLSSPSPPAPNPSQHHTVFSSESTLCMRWPKYWSFSFSIIPSKEIPGLIFIIFKNIYIRKNIKKNSQLCR